ncbi:MAG: helix-turn-helix domain-containing protein [Gammaproteobacteria bacterium]|nr:helix-turn-helix domain-containing protein [Gammaproteobacteria bacterium]MBU1556446.1 helix-turn-helix domain-containing protein [Gammaproteobacteria bacterium]MBU2072200.1 helix-turn-helix domain-containing protein [Gammaproteobacteria bacterium]MBU2182062.1 helix-turn-helix domain-containing protein [Gammaproteobacteria bacterium]MBU2203905.1 helix-turn-helix domain-containing protein [Gammaproteobacteria bacterium]
MLLDYNPVQGQVADNHAYTTWQALAPLNRWVQAFWQLKVPKGQFCYHSVPDNCVDWIINQHCFNDNFLIPPFLSSTLFHIQGPASFFGIRFRILGHQGLIATPLGEWQMAGSVRAEDLLAKEVVGAVFAALENTPGSNKPGFDAHLRLLSDVLLSAISCADVDPRLAHYIRYCYQNVGSYLDLSDSQCAEFGVSARQLRRLTSQHLGLLPKDFAKVLKFQHMLKAMHTAQYSRAYLDHYYDQPHFVREFKRLSGVTPSQFQKMSVLYNHFSSA